MAESDKIERSDEDSLNFNACILNHDILSIVFRKLNGKDLSKVALVCRSWSEAANHEKRLRGPHCFVQDFCFSNTREFSINCIKKLNIKPSIGFFFYPYDSKTRRDVIKTDCISKLLPKNCQSIEMLGSTTGTVTLHDDYLYVAESSAVCVFLPQIPNVKISVAKVGMYWTKDYDKYNCDEDFKYDDGYAKYKQMIEEASSQDHEKCLMLFSTFHDCHTMIAEMYSFAQSRFKKDDKIITLGNVTMLDQFSYFDKKKTANREEIPRPLCDAVLITGSIKTWSITIDKECETNDKIEKKLKLFKKQVKLQKHFVGFVFGNKKFKDTNDLMNTKYFKKLFPKVPVVGFYVGTGDLYRRCTSCKRKFFFNNKEPNQISWECCDSSVVYMILTYG